MPLMSSLSLSQVDPVIFLLALMVYQCKCSSSQPLLFFSSSPLSNYSHQSGVFPSDWKHFYVVPIPKSSSPTFSSDYSPISLYSIISKLLERHVYNFLCDYYIANTFSLAPSMAFVLVFPLSLLYSLSYTPGTPLSILTD